MCVVSMVGDYYRDRWTPQPSSPAYPSYPVNFQSPVSRAEFDALKREVEEMKDVLRAAKRVDDLLGQPDCEMDEKLAVLRKVAELVGVDLDDVLKAKP